MADRGRLDWAVRHGSPSWAGRRTRRHLL